MSLKRKLRSKISIQGTGQMRAANNAIFFSLLYDKDPSFRKPKLGQLPAVERKSEMGTQICLTSQFDICKLPS